MLKRPLTFKRGDKGPFIVDIQAMFAELGFDPGKPEGVFVAKTEDAVRVFQTEYGLPVTGVIDPETLSFLYEEANPGGYPKALIEGEESDIENGESSSEYDSTNGKSEEPSTEQVALGSTKQTALESIKQPDPESFEQTILESSKGSSEQIKERQGKMRSSTPSDSTDNAIVISLSERALGLYKGGQLVKRYPVAIGKPSTPTPIGTHKVLEKLLYPGGGLGTRWIGFTYQMHGIHGTNRPELIGQEVSNGCVRMHNSNVEELYEMVDVGAPVVVIMAPVQSWSKVGGPDFASGASGAGLGQPQPGIGQADTGVDSNKLPFDKSTGTSGQQGMSPGQAGIPGGLLDPSSPQPKDPKYETKAPAYQSNEVAGGADLGRTYTVQPGDSIWAIARRFGASVDAIVKINGIKNPALIYPGEVLKIP